MEKFTDVNGINLCYDECGNTEGELVVLIHGLSSSKEDMFYLRDVLEDKYKVYTIDCRGHGKSDKMMGYTLNDHAKDVISFCKSLNSDSIYLIGYSMGSYIALKAGELESKLFKKIVLIGTKGDGKSSSVEQLVKDEGYDIGEISSFKFKRILLKSLFSPKTSIFTKLKVLKYRSKVKLTQEDKLAENKALENFDNFKDIDKVKVPVLVIAAESDKINPPEYGLKVANSIKNSRFEVIKDAGHFMLLEKPEELEKLIKNFI